MEKENLGETVMAGDLKKGESENFMKVNWEGEDLGDLYIRIGFGDSFGFGQRMRIQIVGKLRGGLLFLFFNS